MAVEGETDPLVSRHSGRWIGAQVASLRCLILRPGIPRVDDNDLAVQ